MHSPFQPPPRTPAVQRRGRRVRRSTPRGLPAIPLLLAALLSCAPLSLLRDPTDAGGPPSDAPVTLAPTTGAPVKYARIRDEAINESSGLVGSRVHRGVFWTHNDSGDRPRIFAIDRDGDTLGEFAVEGASAVDWEDIAIDDAGHLFLGDIGNNDNLRRDLVVYRVPEPDPTQGSGAVRVDRVLRFRYADQSAFPDPRRNVFDAEALFWRAGSLYLMTKHRGDSETTLYRLPADTDHGELSLAPIASLDVGWAHAVYGNVTAADITPDGRRLAVLTYRYLLLFDVSGRDDELVLQPLRSIALDPLVFRQIEGVAWDGAGLLLGNEQRDLFHLPYKLGVR